MSRAPDHEPLFCSAGDCLDSAVAFGRVALKVGAPAGAAAHEERLAFSLPLCGHHAHLLGFGTTLAFFSNGLGRE